VLKEKLVIQVKEV